MFRFQAHGKLPANAASLFLQRADKRQIKFALLAPEGNSIVVALQSLPAAMPRRMAINCLRPRAPCHLSRLCSPLSPSSCVTTRSDKIGTTRCTPSSTDFWMMLSMILPFGIATSKVMEQGGGGLKIFQRHGKEYCRIARAFSPAVQRNSFPTPSRTATSSPYFTRKTFSA